MVSHFTLLSSYHTLAACRALFFQLLLSEINRETAWSDVPTGNDIDIVTATFCPNCARHEVHLTAERDMARFSITGIPRFARYTG